MPGTFLEETGNAIRNGLCTIIDTAQDFGLGLSAGTDYRGIGASVDILRFAQRLLCNREPSAGYDPPFIGGQCTGYYSVDYSTTYDTRSIPPPNIITAPATITFVYGPIRGLRIDRGSTLEQVIIIGSDSTGSTPQDYGGFAIATSAGEGIISAVITGVLRNGGLPDDCGNFPPELPPSEPGDRTTITNYSYTNNEGDDIDIDATMRFGDLNFTLDGTLQIGGRIEFTNDPFSPEFNFNLNLSTGSVSITPGNPNYPPSGNPNGDNYGADDVPDYPPDVPNSILPPSPDVPEDGTVQVIRGVIITVSVANSRATIIEQVGNPNIYAPALGYINFAISIGGAIAWTSDIPVKNLRNFIHCPWEGGAVEVRGTAFNGVSWELSPVYGTLEKSQVYG